MSPMPTDKSEYAEPFRAFDGLCMEFRNAHEQNDFLQQLFVVGQITMLCAEIYNLDVPAGVVNPGEYFTGKQTHPGWV
jgi:hypothetical protein